MKKKLVVYDLKVFQYLASHPINGIPKIIEVIEKDRELYVIEEYISGETLRDKLNEKGKFSESEAVEIIKNLCYILKTFHQLNPPIVHRDIKPENIMITYDRRVVLVDFNSAKESDVTKMRDTVLFGTTGYAAPEQYGFFSSTPSADIYAIGVLLNELLTGKLPNKQMDQGTWKMIIEKCLKMEPNSRFQTVDELLCVITGEGENTRISKKQSLILPGYRRKNIIAMVLATMWYFIILYSSVMLTTNNTLLQANIIIYRIFFFTVLMTETFWICNFQDVWSYISFTKHKNRVIKICSILLGVIILFFGEAVLLSVLLAFVVG
ncbi:MAG: serine/threonine-protein kinase [Lachnospiraceae bacterium]